MHTTHDWVRFFRHNATHHRVNWDLMPGITPSQTKTILRHLQAWQLGETSDGRHLLRAAFLHARKTGDEHFVEAMQLFIKEEQKHGENLGRYLDMIGQPRVGHNWGDTLFRKARHFNTSMEAWTLAVLTVESGAQVFYQSLKDATSCVLLKQICREILIDEAYHIEFQRERMEQIFRAKSSLSRLVCKIVYRVFYFSTIHVMWFAHRELFKAGGNTYGSFLRKMRYKYHKTLHRITSAEPAPQLSYS
ncbi:ferritin-like domain-containing protein [Chitinophaga barathri]|uniref:Ferritin-like domain-containing protein n=1 Tax=Chitinophaga barathri TaxID=1647451 RepID=A0A3N4MFJ7_9BACT|nr:ferritin-like domain-containing protein [Chitinophaga barathri]RPD42185.1 ferritin-like domain-containing protein [Chitinophaga barathri]